ncbi:MAG: flagellar hook-associated protein FlgK, partial [Chromatiaceae bacterium]|nr:flagellar hook-associated protein FlgK [Chromatiaceae bacterium]
MSALGNATSGLLAFQRAMATTSHNISNASTEGYSRQQIELSTRNPQFIGGSYVGQGVTMSSVRRLQDDLVDTQLRSSLSDSANGSVRAEYAERIDRLLADASTGLAPTLENYFAAVQDVANDPTDTAARTVMLGEAEALEERFDTLAIQLDEQRTLLNGQLETSVKEINQISRSIADLNSEVAAGFASGSPPNDLLDKRDQLLRDLSEKVDVNISTQDDGAINVFIGNGQPLVMRGTA